MSADLPGTDLSGPAGMGGSGFTIDDLSDYLERGRTPVIPEIDSNAECQAMLATLERVGSLSRDLVARDARENPTLDESWLNGLLATIGRELRAGRDIPLATADPTTTLVITEGAVRELVRAAGDSVDGVLVGSCSLEGDLADPAASIRVQVTISVVLSEPLTGLAQRVRERINTELLKHTQLSIDSIDVTVTDMHELTTETLDDES
jgi:uncharacterized alkaline shock family protein YloU